MKTITATTGHTGHPGIPLGPVPGTGATTSTDAFNQIAPRPRNKSNFDQVLRAEIHDPLFMLSRQWQMGEYEFEDTGSAIFAKLAMDLTRLSRIKTGAGVSGYQDDVPLEARIERQPVKWTLKERVKLGKQWLHMLQRAGVTYNATGPGTLFDFATFKAFFLDIVNHPSTHYSFDTVAVIDPSDDTATILQKAKRITRSQEAQYLKLISGRKVDGAKIMAALTNDPQVFNSIDQGVTQFPFIEAVGQQYLDWVHDLYEVPASTTDNCWDEESFTYQAEVSSPQENEQGIAVSNRVLKLRDHSDDHLDWYAFDEKEADQTDDMAVPNPSERVEPGETMTLIPTTGSFPGMPATRWWEFEEGAFNIAGEDLAATDTVKAVLAEFALVYQDDWFMLPKVVPVGATAKVRGIVVKDVFGQHTLVRHTSESRGMNDASWESWDLYAQSSANVAQGVDPTEDALFLAPASHQVMTSEPLEEVVFIRDEMANMVFAIEKKIWTEFGESLDATDATATLKEFLLTLSPEETAITPDAELRYELGGEVPLNWIPFIPVNQSPGTNRSIKLQRASMPLTLSDYEQIPVRPQTDFLRKGINADDTLNGTGASCQYFIAEEVIPRAGIKLQKKVQRTRWFNGKTYLWVSNSKSIGRGEGNSGLAFDRVLDSKTPESL